MYCLFCAAPTLITPYSVTTDNTDRQLFFVVLLPENINVDLYRFNVVESKYDNQMFYQPTLLEEKGFKPKALSVI